MANAAATAAKIVEEDLPSFATESLTYSVGDKVLLHPTTIAFRPGEVSALVGHNGSGKSTLLKLLARQLDPSGGVARFGGDPVQRWGNRAFARAVAYLPQDAPAAPGMTARELVACGRYPWHGALGRFGEEDRGKVEEALRLTHIEHLSDRLVDTLSSADVGSSRSRQRLSCATSMAIHTRWRSPPDSVSTSRSDRCSIWVRRSASSTLPRSSSPKRPSAPCQG